MQGVWCVVGLTVVVACGGGDDDGGGGGDPADAGGSGFDGGGDGSDLTGKVYLAGQDAVNTIHVFENWGGIERGFIAATKTGFVIQDFDADEPLVVADTVGDELFRARVIDVGGEFPYWAVGVGPGGFTATNIDEVNGTHGFFQVDPSSFHVTDIDVLDGDVPRFAIANFEVGRVEVMRWNGFQFEEDIPLRAAVPNVVAIEPLDDTTLLAATEPNSTDEGTLFQVQLAEGASAAAEEFDVGVQPRDIECNRDGGCVAVALGDAVTPIDASVIASGARRPRILRPGTRPAVFTGGIGGGITGTGTSFSGVRQESGALGLHFSVAAEDGGAHFLEFDPNPAGEGPTLVVIGADDPPGGADATISVLPVPGAPNLALVTTRTGAATTTFVILVGSGVTF